MLINHGRFQTEVLKVRNLLRKHAIVKLKKKLELRLVQFKIGEYVSKKEYKIDTVAVFYAELFNEQVLILDDAEIKEAGWFTARNLPKPHMPNVKTILEFYERFQSGKTK